MIGLASTTRAEDLEFEQRFARVEPLLGELQRSTDPLLERATREILATVLELHRRGLERVLEIAGREQPVREALSADDRVSAMLMLHGLHPIPLRERASRSLAVLRDRYRSKLASLDFDVTAGSEIVVRVVPAANACQSTRATLKKDVEEALIAAAPDARRVLVEISEPPPALITLRVRSGTETTPVLGGQR